MGEHTSLRLRRGAAKLLAGGVFAFAAMIPLGPSPALAWNIGGPAWAKTAITYGFATNGSYQFPAWDTGHVQSAGDDWSGTPTPISMASTQASANVTVEGYTANNGYGGTGTCTNSDSRGHCVSGVVFLYFGSQGSAPGNARYDEYIAMHEMGHVLGLGHSCVYLSVMSGPASGCQSQGYDTGYPTAATQDDIDGLNALYPTNTGRGGAGGGCMLLNTTLDLATPPQANANGPTLPSPGGLPVVGPTVQQVEGQLALPLNTVDGVYSSVKPIAASLAGYGVDYAAYTAGETVGKGPGAAGLQSVPLPGPQWDNHPC